ncbi:winged helix-turn-helix domain-containing protein [Mesobacillus sp. LC4]
MFTVQIQRGKIEEVCVSNGDNILRQIPLLPGKQYIINPIGSKMNKKSGRMVIFKYIISTPSENVAAVIYVDTKRPGKVNVEDLDYLPAKQLAGKDAIKLSREPSKDELYEDFLPSFQLYIDILNLINTRKNDNDIAVISQKVISEHLLISPSNVSKRIKQLVRYGALKQLQPGVYKLLYCSIWYTPYRVVHSLIRLLDEHPEIINSYKEQASFLDVPIQDISQAWAYIKSIS